ncbi:YueI family protein [Massilibacterium senegalense]|uniref:YueI family protein n=1 Tax=Massilibacterium senegalense TaxID=1632858 RepID=UPI00078612D8|nr:YueI family protein [Massilibacterium senegalense]
MRNKPNIDDYLQEGIYGARETLPDERRKFLGTIRERIVIALKKGQVREEEIYPEVEQAIQQHKEVKMYLNGHMNYEPLVKYTRLADKHEIRFKMVTNQDYNSEIGLIIACDDAIDKETIYVPKRPEKEEETKQRKSFIERLFDISETKE